jgi:transcriptional regulator with XRE-family HTH domain
MITEKKKPQNAEGKSNEKKRLNTPLFSIEDLVVRLQSGRRARQRFVESHLAKTIAYQLRAMRDERGMRQEELAAAVGMNQNGISRLESPEYGKPTLTTLKRLAAAFDVGLVVRFVPFSQLTSWVSGTAYIDKGLSWDSLAVPSFEAEEKEGRFAEPVTADEWRDAIAVGETNLQSFVQQPHDSSKVVSIGDRRVPLLPNIEQTL